LKAQRDEIFVPESSGHKPGLVEAEVMPLHEGSGAYFANTPQLCNLIQDIRRDGEPAFSFERKINPFNKLIKR